MTPLPITASQVRAIAGYAFARGQAYVQEGRVLACAVDGDAIEGIVHGEAKYHVRVTAQHGIISGRCTCPVEHSMCKHAVALALYHLEMTSDSPPVRTPMSPAAWSQSSADTFATRADLEAWAETNQVTHTLELSAETLCADLPGELVARYGLRYVLGRLSIREVGARDGAARYLGARGIDGAIAGAAHRMLTAAAASVRAGLVEEAARQPPSDPSLVALWSRLDQVRTGLRERSAPRSRAERSAGTWSFDAEGPALVWQEPDRVFRPSASFGNYGSFALVTRLTFPGGGAGRLACNCTNREATCTHGLALIDAVLDALGDAARADALRPMADELLRPGWSRALAELALFDAKPTKSRTSIEVWWHVEHELGSLTLTPLVKKQTKRGGMSAGSRMTPARLLDEHRDQLPEQDLRIAENLASWAPATRAAGTYAVRAFAALIGHPRVAAEHAPDEPLAVVRIPLGFTALAAGDQIRLEPSLDGERFSPRILEPLLRTFGPGEPLFAIDAERGRCMLIDVNDDARKLWAVLERHGDAFPPESHAALLERLSHMEARLPLVVPSALKGKQLASALTTVVRLRLLPDVTLELELFVRAGDGAPLFQPGAGPRDVLLAYDGDRGYVRRNLATESERARAAIAHLPLAGAEEGPPFCFRIGDTDTALDLVAALQTPRPELEAEWLDAKPVVASAVGVDALRVKIERKQDWFGIAGDLKIEAGRLELAILLDAARRQQRFVRVDELRWVELSDALRDRLRGLADQAFVGKHRIELSPGAVPAINALTEGGAKVGVTPEWQLLADRLAASLSLKPKPPATLDATLRDYQLEGHAWLSRVAAWGAGACLADDMGLGKTVQAIAVLLDRARLGPALVLAPTSVALNWVAELERFAPSLTPVVYAHQPDRAKALAKLRKKDVVIASYGLLVRDGALLAGTKFATLVIDEAQALKNPTTRRARAARTLDAGFRIALSGTPFENHLGELWSLFSIVFPGLLGSWEQFRERFAGPIERAQRAVDPAAKASGAEARQALSRVLRPFLLRRTKDEVARELPSRTEIQVPVALSKEEWSLYEDARLAAVAELSRAGKGLRDEQKRFQVLAALTRLRLLASHPRLYDARSTLASSKMRRLLELLDELRSEGHRALVFSQFTSHLALVREELDRAGYVSLYLDGSTALGQRAKLIERFQNGEGEVFLISLKAGGTGINLTAADYVIHLDPWWNPAVEDQATDRAHRIGQTKPVTVYRLVTRGTIEEQILAMHHDKRALVAGILEGTDVAARLTTRDLLALLEAGDRPDGQDGDDDDDGERPVSVH